MNFRIPTCFAAAILLTGAQLVAQAQNMPRHYTVVQLGSLGGTSFESGNMTINDRSWVDSASNLPGDMSHHAFVWINGQITDPAVSTDIRHFLARVAVTGASGPL